MNPPKSSLPWIVCILPVVLMWAALFVDGMYPVGGGGVLLDVAGMMFLSGPILVFPLFFVWFAEKWGPPSLNPHPLSTWIRRARLPLAIAFGGMFTLPFAFALGTRCGGSLGVALQPVRDLKNSPAVARIAASGQPGRLPEAEWPASLRQWELPIEEIEITPVPGGKPQIQMYSFRRGDRFQSVLIRPAGKPASDEDSNFTRWTEEVWLGRAPGD